MISLARRLQDIAAQLDAIIGDVGDIQLPVAAVVQGGLIVSHMGIEHAIKQLEGCSPLVDGITPYDSAAAESAFGVPMRRTAPPTPIPSAPTHGRSVSLPLALVNRKATTTTESGADDGYVDIGADIET